MKTVIVSLNASFSHTSLASAYLYACCQDPRWSLEIREFTINDHHRSILSRLVHTGADVYAFSCYIWNIEMVLRLCQDLRSVLPSCRLVLGGPEVSFDSAEIMQDNSAIDVIVVGEGEQTFQELLGAMSRNRPLRQVPGLMIRTETGCESTGSRPLINDLNSIPSPFQKLLYSPERLHYYETSRGCPFSCAYCLSSAQPGVRYFSLNRVKQDLMMLIKHQVRMVKFVDRTFNCNDKRALEIMEFILTNNISTKFHFEINAELITEAMFDFLSQVPPGLFDFEIGIQSTHQPTLKAVSRLTQWDKLSANISRLQKMGNIHLHVDLIAGLPEESYSDFTRSFNEVFMLKADVIQLGFLKLLKGSPLRDRAAEYHMAYQLTAPYEILSHHKMSFADIDLLHYIEDMVQRYSNSHRFTHSLEFIIEQAYRGNAFNFFEDLAGFWLQGQHHLHPHNREGEYLILMQFMRENHKNSALAVQEYLKCDYIVSFPTGQVPEELDRYYPADHSDILYGYLKDENFIRDHLPELTDLTPRQRRRRVHLEWLQLRPYSGHMIQSPRPTFFLYDDNRRNTIRVVQV